MSNQKAILIILDGWGHGPKPEVSALAQANTPFMDSLYSKYPNAELITHGEDVGLPEGQMGNSEVGHINIGAGRVVYQELARINKSIRDGELEDTKAIQHLFKEVKANKGRLHIMGLASDGGVHSHIDHLLAICDITQKYNLEQVFIHAFTDGRDTAPTSGVHFLNKIQNHIKSQTVEIASVVGRYYAMDRDNRWERIKVAYDALVHGKGQKTQNIKEAISTCYNDGITDEFIKSIIHTNESGDPIAKIESGDAVLFINFRTDRPRELTQVLTQKDFPEHGMKKLDLRYTTMTRYDETFKGIDVVFSKEDLTDTLGEVLSKMNRTQVRIAETEKYPHVTFFFSGGNEKEVDGERRIMIPSPKVATYDLQPEMSAIEITDAITDDIKQHQPDFICLNYANTDMVGHTGVFDAAIKAAETVDTCLDRLVQTCLEHHYHAIIIADHGNSDYMINEDGSPHTAHTTNLVPVIWVSESSTGKQIRNGRLADVAPTILDLMEVEKPETMTGKSLIER